MSGDFAFGSMKGKLLLAAAAMAVATPSFAVPVVDGFLSDGEYENSFVAGWYNGHEEEGSQYQKAGDHETTVWWTSTDDNLFLYLEVPLHAKNMVWGAGFTDELALAYYQQWCSPDDGNPAALDGSNCGHHGDGFEKFRNEKGDYGTMTGSEKAIFAGGYVADLGGTAGGGGKKSKKGDSGGDSALAGKTTLEYSDSVDYVISALGCDTTDCGAIDVPMGFELKFDAFSADEIAALIALIQGEEIEYHLSPEWAGPTQVPEPGTLLLLGLGLAVMRTRRSRMQHE